MCAILQLVSAPLNPIPIAEHFNDTMTQTRFSNLTIFNTHKQRTDNLCLIDIANEFTALNDKRRKNFGTFKESDFKISG